MGTPFRTRYSDRGGNGRGFTLVELLITIVIAGIVFAAMVPLFVGAVQKNTADLFRQTALNTAQDRIEKIRALDYGSITQANLNSPTFVSGTFGPTIQIGSGTSVRTFNVSYAVNTFTNYKVVAVSVSWTPPPTPVKTVVVQTVIYRQYAGPTLASFYVTPAVNSSGVIGVGTSLTSTPSSMVTLSAIPTTPWLGGATASVQFTVSNSGGTAVNSQTVTYTSDGSSGYGTAYGVTNNTFWWNWDSTGAPDGIYAVSGTGFSGSYFGPTERFYFTIQRGTLLPAPQYLTATPGQTSVTLNWSSVPNATKYNIYRSVNGVWTLIGTAVGPTATTYTDAGPLTPMTAYQYEVAAVDAASNQGAVATISTTTTGAAVALPSAPQNLTATGDTPSPGVIQLQWYQPANWGSAPQDYLVETSANGTSGWTTVNPTVAYNASPYPSLGPFIYSDTVGPGVTAYFRVTARAVGGVAGGVSNVVSATTAPSTYLGPLTLTNTNTGASKDRWVWVQLVSSGMYYNTSGQSFTAALRPAGVDVPPKNGTQVFSNLPNGTYNVWVSTSSSFSDAGSNPQTSATINNAPAAANIQ